MNTYALALEHPWETYWEIEPLYREHYAEMQAYLATVGVTIGDYNPRKEVFRDEHDAGRMLHYVVRFDGKAVGYSNVWLGNDLHSNELTATEDTVFITREHRAGVGKQLIKMVLRDLRSRGFARFIAGASTDPRMSVLWSRIGFKHGAQLMIYSFKDEPDVRTETTSSA